MIRARVSAHRALPEASPPHPCAFSTCDRLLRHLFQPLAARGDPRPVVHALSCRLSKELAHPYRGLFSDRELVAQSAASCNYYSFTLFKSLSHKTENFPNFNPWKPVIGVRMGRFK